MKIGIDLGGSHIAVGIVSEEGKILAKQEQDISFTEENNNIIKELIRDTMLSLINVTLRQMQIPIFLIEEVGIGIPGIIENNKIKKCNKFRINDWDLAKELEEHYQIPVKLQNDAICSAFAEYTYGNLQNVETGLYICLGTGIGGAIILNKKIVQSELGHMIIQKENGRECNCLNRGCFETYCSMRVFKREVIKLLNLNKDTTSEELLKILVNEKQNNILNDYIDKYINDIIVGLSNIINIMNLKTICIGGSFAYFEEILYKRLLEKAQLYSYLFEKPKIVLSKLKNDAGIIGATLI